MYKDYTPKSRTNATPSECEPDRSAAADLGILIRPIGLGFSGSSGIQETWRAHSVDTSLRGVAWAFETKAKIGAKGDCPCFYSGSFLERGQTTRANVGDVWYAFGDYEKPENAPRGFIEGNDEIETLENFHRDLGGYVVASSSSHDPLGLHPDERKRGQWRIRSAWQWGRAISYEDHRYAYLAMMRALAVRLGHTDLPECVGHGSDLYTALAEIGADTALSRACQPLYIPRWPSEGVKEQAFVRWIPGPPVDPDPWLAQWRDVERRERPARVSSSRTSIPVDVAAVALDERTRRLELYVAAIPGAGAGRRNQAAWGPCRAAVGLGVDLESAWPFVAAWGARCSPAMDAGELRRRLERAYRDPSISLGDMLERAPSAGSTPPFKTPTPLSTGGGGPGPLASGAAVHPPAAVHPLRECVDSDDPIAERVHRRYLSEVTLADLDRLGARVWIRDSECGTGKNYTLRPCFRDLRPGEVGMHITYRESLAITGSNTFEIRCYKDIAGEIQETAAVCVDSTLRVDLAALLAKQDPDLADLHHPQAGRFPIAFILWDECDAIVRHLDGKTIRGKGVLGDVLSQVQALAQMAGVSILQADGASTVGLARRAFQRFLGDAYTERLQVNTYRRPRTFLRYLGGHSHLEKKLLDDLRDTVAGTSTDFRFVPCSTRGRAKRIAEKIRTQVPGVQVWEVHRDNVDTDEVKALLADLSLLGGRHAIVYSPSLNDGVSFEGLPGQTYFFGDAGEWTSTMDAWQIIHRGRDVDTWHVSIEGQGVQGPPFAESVYENLTLAGADQYERLKGISTSDLKYDPQHGTLRLHPHNDTATRIVADVRAYKHRESHIQLTFWQFIASRGHEIVDVDDPLSKEERIAIANEHTAIKEAQAADLRSAVLDEPARSDGEIEGLRSESGTPEAQAALLAHSIRRRYGVDEIHPDLYDRDQERGRWAAVKLLQHVEALEDGEWEHLARLEAKDYDRPGGALHVDAREAFRAARAALQILRNHGITRIRDVLDSFEIEVPEYPLRGVGGYEAKRLLGITALKGAGVLGELCERLGLERKYKRPRGEEGKRKRVYAITRESYGLTLADGAFYRKRLRGEEIEDARPSLPDDPVTLDGVEIHPCIVPTTPLPANDLSQEREDRPWRRWLPAEILAAEDSGRLEPLIWEPTHDAVLYRDTALGEHFGVLRWGEGHARVDLRDCPRDRDWYPWAQAKVLEAMEAVA